MLISIEDGSFKAHITKYSHFVQGTFEVKIGSSDLGFHHFAQNKDIG